MVEGGTKIPWTDEEIEILNLCVLEGKERGDKMKDVWERAAEMLKDNGRTPGTCSWRFYSSQPKETIRKTERHVTVTESTSTTEMSLSDVTSFIESIIVERDTYREQVFTLQNEIALMKARHDEELAALEDEVALKVREETAELRAHVQEMEQDYSRMMQMIEKARRMAFVDEPGGGIKPRFKMDANGNLERI
jgi:prespore-specific regulator